MENGYADASMTARAHWGVGCGEEAAVRWSFMESAYALRRRVVPVSKAETGKMHQPPFAVKASVWSAGTAVQLTRSYGPLQSLWYVSPRASRSGRVSSGSMAAMMSRVSSICAGLRGSR